MKEFKISEKLNKKVWEIIHGGDPMAIAEACSGFINEETTVLEAAGIGYSVGLEAKGRPVYAIRDDENDETYLCIGTPEEILEKIKSA